MQPREHDVLVVIDLQNGFMGPASTPVIKPVVDLVDRWTQSGGSVLLTRYINRPNSPYTRLIRWHKMMSSPEIDLVDELAPYQDRCDVLDKEVYTAFTTEGRDLFARRGWTTPYIVGVDTESCVAKTAVDAFELDLTPRVITDACASHAGAEAHEAGLLVMGRNLGCDQLIRLADLEQLLEAA